MDEHYEEYTNSYHGIICAITKHLAIYGTLLQPSCYIDATARSVAAAGDPAYADSAFIPRSEGIRMDNEGREAEEEKREAPDQLSLQACRWMPLHDDNGDQGRPGPAKV